MKFAVAVNDREYVLDFEPGGERAQYHLAGAVESAGSASIVEVTPGVFSILLDSRSFTVHVAPNGSGIETWTGADRRIVSLSDSRDRSDTSKSAGAAGPLQVKAQMPGKVIKLLVSAGEMVESGQGLVVVEAMKMQNEMKSRKTGIVAKIVVREGATVAAGEILMVVE
jgi:biotin carboxyl carrier protein